MIINCNWVITRWQWLFYMYTNMNFTCKQNIKSLYIQVYQIKAFFLSFQEYLEFFSRYLKNVKFFVYLFHNLSRISYRCSAEEWLGNTVLGC